MALLDWGYAVDVVCTRRRGEALVERDGALRVFRVPVWHRRGGLAGYLVEYLLFFLVAAAVAGILDLRRRYRLVQVHTLPDSLVFSAWIPRARGARVLLDLHECMPEFVATKFSLGFGHPAVRSVAAIEQAAIRFADRAITCTDQMRAAFVRRGASADQIDVVLNSADERVFDPARHPARAEDGSFVLVSHGALEERYGVDTVMRAVALLAADLPGVRLEVFGEGSQAAALRQLAADLGVASRVCFSDGYVPIDDLVAALAGADAGVVAVRRDAFRDLTHCNKMYDLVSMGKPVIASRTASAAAYFGEDCFAWFDSGDAGDLARAIRAVHDDPAWRGRLVDAAARRAEPYRWPRQERLYLAAVDRALGEDVAVAEPGPGPTADAGGA